MTKSEAKKWGKAVEGVTGGDKVSQNVCKGTGTGSDGTKKCGTSTAGATSGTTAQTKISAVFTSDTETAQLSTMDNTTINTTGMANNINSLSKEEKAVVARAVLAGLTLAALVRSVSDVARKSGESHCCRRG
ncbi:hypothetical protein [Anaplasma marginale]